MTAMPDGASVTGGMNLPAVDGAIRRVAFAV
jgi:hypothetical protein